MAYTIRIERDTHQRAITIRTERGQRDAAIAVLNGLLTAIGPLEPLRDLDRAIKADPANGDRA